MAWHFSTKRAHASRFPIRLLLIANCAPQIFIAIEHQKWRGTLGRVPKKFCLPSFGGNQPHVLAEIFRPRKSYGEQSVVDVNIREADDASATSRPCGSQGSSVWVASDTWVDVQRMVVEILRGLHAFEIEFYSFKSWSLHMLEKLRIEEKQSPIIGDATQIGDFYWLTLF
ncbi:hypothetical protein BC938DRAFT_477294 [Jimgerdemannia flammicorona]|uniref:Uncharacterized protein n=1 Tax=Jimgerdemannia flammicorona TaxID=994334 RepID=A0A433QPL1_9FUNG|nr:hypothetical protein BC938DRAFT_477294 [Jimgerdemannia flammicorona]